MTLKLFRPSHEYAEQVMEYKSEMLANHDSFDGCAGLEDVTSFEEWIDFESKRQISIGIGPADGRPQEGMGSVI